MKTKITLLPPPGRFKNLRFNQLELLFFRNVTIITGLIILNCSFEGVFAQSFECFSPEESGVPKAITPSSNTSCYDPTQEICIDYDFPFSEKLDQLDVITIYLNFHFMETDYSENFGPNDANCPQCPDNNNYSGQDLASFYVSALNDRMSNLSEFLLLNDYVTGVNYGPGIPITDQNGNIVLRPGSGTTSEGDTKIRFALYEENDDNGISKGSVHYWDIGDQKLMVFELNENCKDGQSSISLPDWKRDYSVYGDKVIDIFYFDEWVPDDSCVLGRGISSGTDPLASCAVANLYSLFEINQFSVPIEPFQPKYDYSAILLHEIGHNAGLFHPFNNGQCCDADESPYRVQPNGNVYGISNNVMGYNPHATALSPCQLDIFYETISTKNYHSGADVLGFCVKSPGFIEITNHETWDTDKTIDKDVIVRSGGSLTITGSGVCIGFARNAVIQVERGAILRIEDATLKSLCTIAQTFTADQDIFSRHWGGIRVIGNSAKSHPNHYNDPIALDDPGRVIMEGAIILDARHAISTSDLYDFDNPQKWGGYINVFSTTFKGCFRVAEFMRYDKPNKSEFLHCSIEGFTNVIDERFYPPKKLENAPATTVRGLGISIWRCHGIEIKQCDFRLLYPYGIFSIDGSAKVYNGNRFENIHGVGIWGGDTGRNRHPWQIGGSDPVEGNYFDKNTLDIRFDNLFIRESKIVHNEFNHSNQNALNKAIELTGGNVEIAANDFFNKNNVISVSSSGQKPVTISNNYLQDFNEGLVFLNTNGRLTQYLCNQFYGIGRNGVNMINDLANQGSRLLANHNYWHRTDRSPGAFDIYKPQPAFEPGEHTYFVYKNEPSSSPFRPQCNLTVQCPGSFLDTPDYVTDDSENINFACNIKRNDYSIQDLVDANIRIDSLKLFVHNSDSLQILEQLYGRKLAMVYAIIDSLDVLGQSNKIDSLLATQEEVDYTVLRLEIALEESDLTNANQRLAELSNKDSLNQWASYHFVQSENIQWLSDNSYRPVEEVKSALTEISLLQDKAGAVARLLLCHWYAQVPPPFIIESEGIESRKALDKEIEGVNGDHKTAFLDLIVSPNPSSGLYQIRGVGLPSSGEEKYTLQIINAVGLVQFQKIDVNYNMDAELDLSDMPGGVYYVRLYQGNVPVSSLAKLIKL